MRITIRLHYQYSYVTYYPKVGWLGKLLGRKPMEPFTERYKTNYDEYRGGGHIYHNMDTGEKLPYGHPVGKALDEEYEMCRMKVGRYLNISDYDYSKVPDGEYYI